MNKEQLLEELKRIEEKLYVMDVLLTDSNTPLPLPVAATFLKLRSMVQEVLDVNK